MNRWQKGLIINNAFIEYGALLRQCTAVLHSTHNPQWEKEIFNFIAQWISDEEYIVQYSSGTTGESKKIILPKESMMRSAMNTCKSLDLRSGQSALLCLPVNYIAGKMMIVRCFTNALNLIMVEPTGTPDLSSYRHIDFAAMVPLQVMNILYGKGSFPISKLIIGGAEINTELENLVSRIATETYATYGMAETCSHIALRRISGPAATSDYHALPEVILQSDERECLVIKASYLPETIVTNDIVKLTGPGSFQWIGRYDNLINSGGIKIVPEEMEARIKEATGNDCIISAIPDEKLGNRLILVIEGPEDPQKREKLTGGMSLLLPRNIRPKKIIFLDKFPRNSAFKIDRKELIKLILKAPENL